MFCAPGLVFGGIEGVGSHFHGLRSRTYFRRYGGRRVQLSCFARPNLFSAVPRASGPLFKFCAPGLIFGGTVVVGSRFYVLRVRTHFSVFSRASGPVFMFCASELIFGGTEGVGSRFNVLRARTRFRRYRGPRVKFSCFVRLDSFSTVQRASGPVFMFCAPGLVFVGTESVASRFHVLRARIHFWRYRGRRFPFSCSARRDSFSAVRVRRVPFSCFASPDLFSAIPRASGPVFMSCALGLVFDVTVRVGSRFHVLPARTSFRRY
jgi:hypothetical protein